MRWLFREIRLSGALSGLPQVLVPAIYLSLALGSLAGAAVFMARLQPMIAIVFALAIGMVAAACVLLPIGWRLLVALRAARSRARTTQLLVEERDRRIAILQASERSYRGLVDAQDDLIIRRDLDRRISYVNDAYSLLFGKPRSALLGTHFEPQRLDSTGDTKNSTSNDCCLMTIAGPRWFSLVESPVRDRTGAVVAWQSVGRDITERKVSERALREAREKAESASHSKSRFLATMSHEMRTPLNGILGMAALLIDTHLSPEQTTYARAVKTSGESLLALIDDLLDFSKIEAGHLELRRLPVDLPALIEEVVELMAPRAHAKGIEMVASIDPDIPGEVRGDATRIRQILMNLVSNAVKFTDRGGVVVRARRYGGNLALCVEDTGVGIPAGALSRIFNEFEQVDQHNLKRPAGTGLGLAITKRLVEAMGGGVAVESEAGKGSIFSVDLPLFEEAPMVLPPATLAGRRILIVSAGAFEGETVAADVRRAGGEARLARSAAEAGATLREGWPHVVLADRRLGRGALRDIIALGAGCGTRPRIVVLLTPADRGEIAALRGEGCDAYLVRPVRRVSLIAQLLPDSALASDPRMPLDETPRAPDEHAPLSILLAEDNAINALLAQALIEKLGHHVVHVTDGRGAVEAWRVGPHGDANKRFDLVLMDVQMPELDGAAAARIIRAEEQAAGLQRCPIIALTANAFAEDRDAVLAAGKDEHMAKPIDRERFEAILLHLAATTPPPKRRLAQRSRV